MASLRKMIAQVIEDLEKYGVTDDSIFDYELIKDKLISAYRSTLGEFYRGKQSLDPFFQIIDCVPVKCYQDKCIVAGIVFTDKTTYYVADLPVLAVNVGYNNLLYIGLEGYTKSIDRVSLDEILNSAGARYTSSASIVTLIGNKALFKNIPLGLQCCKLIAILYDPTSAPDWSDDKEFPVPSDIKIMLMVKKDIMSTQGMPDLLNDAQRALGNQPAQKEKQPKQDQQEEE